jgi:hypothetical protein
MPETLQLTESNLYGYLEAGVSATATTITARFYDKVSGSTRTPQSTTKLFVIDKGTPTAPNSKYEVVLASSHSTDAEGLTTITVATNGRGLYFYGSTLTGTGTGQAHVSRAEIGTADVHYLWNLLANKLNGTDAMSNALDMGSHKINNVTDPTSAQDAATKNYVDGVAIAGGADASTTVKGISKMSVAPASATNPIAVGDNDPRLTFSGATASATNKIVTQTGLQNSDGVYAADSVGTDAYAITLAPAVAAYAAGQRFSFKAGTANTGAATLAVNGLAATPILKSHDQALETGDIESGQIVTVVFDGTNFQMQSQLASQMTTATITDLTDGGSTSLHSHLFACGQTSRATGAGTGTTTIAHGLGVTPKLVKITALRAHAANAGASVFITSESFGSSTSTGGTCTRIGVGSGGGSGNIAGTIEQRNDAIIYLYPVGTSNAESKATISTLDATNIVLNFTIHGTAANTSDTYIQWEAFA